MSKKHNLITNIMEPVRSDLFKYILTFVLVGLSLFAPLSSDIPAKSKFEKSSGEAISMSTVSVSGSKVTTGLILPFSK